MDAARFDRGIAADTRADSDEQNVVRSTVDLPDDEPGAFQVHVLYVEPSDRTASPQLDTDGSLRRSLEAMLGWMRLQTGGPVFRFDRASGVIDITYVKLEAGSTEQAMATGIGLSPAGSVFIRDRLERQLQTTFSDPNKLYLVYYDGLALAHCGGAAYPPALRGHFTAQYVGGVFAMSFAVDAVPAGATQINIEDARDLAQAAPPYSIRLGTEALRVTSVSGNSLTLLAATQAAHPAGELVRGDTTIPPCRANVFSPNGRQVAYHEMGVAHEILHPLGIVPSNAADFAPAPIAPGHLHGGNPVGVNDVMYQGNENWGCARTFATPEQSTCRIDPMHRNYYRTEGATSVDLARSAFLTPLPTDATPPPGW